MKRLLALIAGGLGLGALLRRRRRTVATPAPGAEDLRAKLAASRTVPEEPPAPAEPVPTEPAPAADDVAARRADVHDRARRALDELGE